MANISALVNTIICGVILLGVSLQSHGAKISPEVNLLRILMKNYDHKAFPKLKGHGPVAVHFEVVLRNILKVDDRQQVVKTKVWIRQKWKNELLTWNATKWNISSVSLPPEKLWLPDIVLYNSAGDIHPGGTEIFKTMVTAFADGTHLWNSLASFVLSASLDVKYFPFDKQRIYFRFGSWTNDQSRIDIFPGQASEINAHLTKSSEWDVLSTDIKKNVIKYECCQNPFVDVQFFINLKREPMYYTFTLIFPCLLLLPLTIVTFSLPPESGERIGLTITILLAVTVFLQITSDSLPRSSDNVPIIGIFFIAIMGTTTLSLVITAVVLILHFKGDSAYKLPQWARTLFITKIGRFILMNECKSYELKKLQAVSLVYKNGTVDRVKIEKKDDTDELSNLELLNVLKETNDNSSSENKILLNILKKLDEITSSLDEEKQTDIFIQEWKLLARIVDRLMLITFFIACLSFSCSFLITIYTH